MAGGAIESVGILTVSNSTFSGNTSVYFNGGAIWSVGALTVSNSTFFDNSSVTTYFPYHGWTIASEGLLTINNSTISNNQGGGIYSSALLQGVLTNSLTVNNTTISSNSGTSGGGGIYYGGGGGSFTVNNSTISNNTADGLGGGGGGGILSWGPLTLGNSTISNNTSAGGGGGIYSGGPLTVSNSTFAGNSAAGQGGGIFVPEAIDVTITNSTFSANSALVGGGISYFDTNGLGYYPRFTVSNSTFVGNSARFGGAVSFNMNDFYGYPGAGLLTNVTITGNRCDFTPVAPAGGGGIIINNGDLALNNTIVANNFIGPSPSTTPDNVYGAVRGSNNLFGVGLYNLYGANNLIDVADPGLAPLGNYGGPTRTMPLLPGSPALGAGSAALAVDASDQRGLPRVVGGAIDIGAVENQMLGGVDNDGVSDAVENGAPNSGDGNGDGVPDRDQVNVTSLPNAVNGSYVTLQSPAGTSLADVQTVTNPPAGAPPRAQAPVGFFDFQVQGVTSTAPVTVTLYMPAGVKVNKYFKYGLEPVDNPATTTLNEATDPHWWDFKWDGTTGAQFVKVNGFTTKIVLTFVDNGRGDDDPAAGIIADPGAPVFVPIEVQIDIRSTVNLASQGRIAVAIFSTAGFDATLVDVASVRFAGATAVQWTLQDVNGDGRLDMVLQFRTQDTNLRAVYEQLLADDINADGVLDSNHQEATIALTGSTSGDEQFEGSDTLDLFLSGKALRQMLDQMASAGLI